MVDCVCRGGGFFLPKLYGQQATLEFLQSDSLRFNERKYADQRFGAGAGLLRAKPFYRKPEPINFFIEAGAGNPF